MSDGATVKAMSDAVLKCRGGYNHSWDDCPPRLGYVGEGHRGHWEMWLRCNRCRAERLDIVNKRTGELEGRRYWLPEGYSLAGLNGERPKRTAYRREIARRHNV